MMMMMAMMIKSQDIQDGWHLNLLLSWQVESLKKSQNLNDCDDNDEYDDHDDVKT